MNIAFKIRQIILNPYNFFDSLNKEKGILPAVIFSLFLSLFYLVVVIIIMYGRIGKLVYLNGEELILGKHVLNSFTGWLGVFLHAGITHFWLKLFKGKASYTKTYQLIVYSSLPAYLYGWIPVIGSLVAGVHVLIISIIGVQCTHGLSRKNAIWSNIIPLILLLILAIGVYVVQSV